jgi:hypothetical protein
VRVSDQILEYLDGPKREDRYDRTILDRTPMGKATTDQIQHYLACRRVVEEHLDEETVFEELCRLRMQADEETGDWFDRITNSMFDRSRSRPSQGKALNLAERLAAEVRPIGSISRSILAQIAYGMLRDGWAEHQIEYALGTLGAA